MELLRKRIIVADDEELIREVIRKAIERFLGYEVIEAVDGVDALEKVERLTPNLLITDIRMPRMDGMQVLEEIRTRGLDLPVVILTGYGQIEDALKAIKLGAKGFMKKPFDLSHIITLIESIFTTVDEREDISAVMAFVRSGSLTLQVPNNFLNLEKVVNYVISVIRSTWQVGRNELNDLRVAFYEAVVNAFEHGNLKIDKSEKERCLLKGHSVYRKYLLEQMQLEENKGKFITCFVNIDPVRVEVAVLDEGDGFDHSRAYEDFEGMSPDEFMKTYGRGLFLIRKLVDEVSFNEKGNLIKLVKYRPRLGGEPGSPAEVVEIGE